MNEQSRPSLLSIIAHARSGALERAWAMFREGGYDRVKGDPAVLSVLGRLLKDRALAAKGDERRRLYLKAADAYAAAGAIRGASYPLINAATLSLLAGRRKQSQTLARKVLTDSLGGENEPETPYWRMATRAEARLLLGEIERAKQDFREAIVLAPRAYEDHASTLRQFGLILDELKESKTWLDALRPPRSLHFAGHMGLSSRGGTIERQIRAFIQHERIGFGFGALAAGADILIAEALLEAGAELHLVLPTPRRQFREASVARFGAGWARRFDSILQDATTVRSVAKDGDPLSPLAIGLATEISMGAAVMQASLLMTEAVQLLILENARKGGRAAGISGSAGAVWRAGDRRQHVILAPRVRTAAAAAAHARGGAGHLAAMLRIDLAQADIGQLAKILPQLARALLPKRMTELRPQWTGEEVLSAFDDVTHAARAALSAIDVLRDVPSARIAAHYAIVDILENPLGGGAFLAGAQAHRTRDILQSTPPGAIHVSEDFAAALHAGEIRYRPRTEYVGELPHGEIENPIRLYSLRR